jgi:NTP pyrophosphatase (non-canonical NTP hydrolase)|tara:strand:- start:183 stop:635 length:453 start_codon:yes stop_codon:yes gene_type:complete
MIDDTLRTAFDSANADTDESLLLDYTRFVDEVTSDASKDSTAFSDALDIIDEQGVPPERLITAAMGLSAESGEFMEIVKKCLFQGKPMDEHTIFHAKRELGDIFWYLAQACIALDTTIEDVIYMNIEKLEGRYPDGFEAFRSNNRKEGDV